MGDNLFEKNVFDLDTDNDFFSPFGGLGSRHGLGGAFRYALKTTTAPNTKLLRIYF